MYMPGIYMYISILKVLQLQQRVHKHVKDPTAACTQMALKILQSQ